MNKCDEIKQQTYSVAKHWKCTSKFKTPSQTLLRCLEIIQLTFTSSISFQFVNFHTQAGFSWLTLGSYRKIFVIKTGWSVNFDSFKTTDFRFRRRNIAHVRPTATRCISSVKKKTSNKRYAFDRKSFCYLFLLKIAKKKTYSYVKPVCLELSN